MKSLIGLLLPMLGLATAASAQTDAVSPDEEEQTVCIGTPQWRPTLAEAVAVEAEPVPAAFRRLYESSEPCLELRHNAMLLADWHLRFGSARSLSAALAFAERRYLQSEPAPDSFPAMLRRAWPAAERALRREREPDGARGPREAREIARLEALVETRQKYVFLATQYLRGAEEFGALPLLEKAERYLRAAVAGSDFLAPLEARPPVQNRLYFNLDIFLTDDLEMRAAVLRASLSRAPADIARAETVVQSKERPYYRRLAEQAFSGGDDFCDISDGYGQSDELEATCRAADEDDEIHARVVNQLISRAMLDLVQNKTTATTPDAADEVALRLLERERMPDRSRCCRRDPVDDIVRLRLARAEHFVRRLAAGRDRHSSYGGAWDQALTDLEAAERLTRPHEAPARTRRLARAWLDLYDRTDALFPPDPGEAREAMISPTRRRYAVYLRQLLAGLDAITAGLPPRAN